MELNQEQIDTINELVRERKIKQLNQRLTDLTKERDEKIVAMEQQIVAMKQQEEDKIIIEYKPQIEDLENQIKES